MSNKKRADGKSRARNSPYEALGLFGGLCFGETRYAGYFLNLAAFAEQVNAFEAFENAAFFGRCGAAAFEAVVL